MFVAFSLLYSGRLSFVTTEFVASESTNKIKSIGDVIYKSN